MTIKNEIEQIARLMKIEITDYDEYVNDIEQILAYFKIIDNINVDLINMKFIEMSLENLRDDKYIQYNEKLIDHLKHYDSNFIRSPKLK